ncbi:PITH domain-containing protein GA19395 [Osmia bicornis bicornis]|uniref:PITH domain-containing protein GA19395 n=1 Tax=Osmia bicornis bicornis TaxID=1437191 RepID=UPI0010F545CD|nr:PITH domain-containing protein GA19395 [Osmia bicornis bicornis]XP_029056234.1 PITH domain-containing protein GA19395 [Osmia bicornis bicornis]XP_029056236.1 PITH domain-containing protein GA19395 [Osmia bicornis bicornis]XP_029056237.1 PITH domain-containing protein GA19395 [Osmia bicornis bicornis]
MAHQCGCGASHEEGELGVQYNLYKKIDIENIEVLNECEEGSGAAVFKPWENRLDRTKYVESDMDNELLFNIPFTGNIKLKGLIIIGGEDDLHPNKVKLYKNRPYMTFDDAATAPEQEFELCVDTYGVHEYAPKVVKFSSVHHLSLHFTGTEGSEKIKIYYIGLKGEWSPGHQHGVTICTYELLPQMSDHMRDNLEDIDRAIS